MLKRLFFVCMYLGILSENHIQAAKCHPSNLIPPVSILCLAFLAIKPCGSFAPRLKFQEIRTNVKTTESVFSVLRNLQ